MTPSQLSALKADILADPTLLALYNAGDRAGLAAAYNASAVPTFYVWRTDVSRSEIYHKTSGEGTIWDWNVYKAQSPSEQGAWVQMFMGDQADFSLPNLRAGVDKIFAGTGANAAQRTHVAATAKRSARRVEKLFADTGNGGVGSLASPAVLTFEGEVTPDLFVEV